MGLGHLPHPAAFYDYGVDQETSELHAHTPSCWYPLCLAAGVRYVLKPDAAFPRSFSSRLDAQCPAFLKVGLGLGASVVDLELGGGVADDDLSGKTARGLVLTAADDRTVHDQRHVLGAAEPKWCADGRLEPGPSPASAGRTRPVRDFELGYDDPAQAPQALRWFLWKRTSTNSWTSGWTSTRTMSRG